MFSVKRKVSDIQPIVQGDTIQCGVVFTQPTDRTPQNVVGFFALNGDILYHCKLEALYGGLYPTVAFSPTGKLYIIKPYSNGISPLAFDPLVLDPLIFDPLVFDPLVFDPLVFIF